MSIEDEKKFSIGALDVSARSLEDAHPAFEELFQAGHTRMRAEEIARIKKYLRRIGASNSKLRATLKKFEALNK